MIAMMKMGAELRGLYQRTRKWGSEPLLLLSAAGWVGVVTSQVIVCARARPRPRARTLAHAHITYICANTVNIGQ